MAQSNEKLRLQMAALAAISLHISVIAIAARHVPAPQAEAVSIIAVKLVVKNLPVEPAPSDVSATEDVPDPKPPVPDPPIMADTQATMVGETVESYSDVATLIPPENTPPELSPRLAPDASSPTVTFDPRWKLNAAPATKEASPIVSGLTQTLDCSKGFDVRCADVRKAVFADQQLSETDKVWMPSYASSGLSDPRFKDMSEAQIRVELAIPTANENAWLIPLSTIGVSSYWTDLLYGVNKRCKAVLGINPNGGTTELIQDCPELRDARRDAPLWRNKVWAPGGVDSDPADWLKKKKPEP